MNLSVEMKTDSNATLQGMYSIIIDSAGDGGALLHRI